MEEKGFVDSVIDGAFKLVLTSMAFTTCCVIVSVSDMTDLIPAKSAQAKSLAEPESNVTLSAQHAKVDGSIDAEFGELEHLSRQSCAGSQYLKRMMGNQGDAATRDLSMIRLELKRLMKKEAEFYVAGSVKGCKKYLLADVVLRD